MERVVVEENLDHLNADIERMLEKAEMARTQSVSDVFSDIRKMIDNPAYSDIVFLCKDGARVHASRLFLVARNVVLHRMLLNGMVESQLSEITLHQVSSTELLPVMEFLYTGTLQEHAPKDWKNAYEIIGAARFFLLEGLELIAVDYLLLATAKMGADLAAAADFLSITVEFLGILGETVELIARDLVCILESKSLKPEHLQALTSNAFQYFLQTTKTENADPKFLSHTEFLRLRNIVLWCACKQFASEKSLALHTVPPEIKSTLELLEKPPVQREFMACQQAEIFKNIRSALALSVMPYLPLINLRRIPPRLLVHVVEPMEIVPSCAIMDALRFHALRTADNTEEGTLGWSTSFKNQETYRMGRGGFVIQQTGPGIGFARYDLAIDRETCGGIYEWEIIIEKACDGFIEIGLLHDLGGNFIPHDGYSLSGQPGGWALRMDPQGLSINRRGTHRIHRGDPSFARYGKDCSQLVYGKHYAHKNSKVKVRLDMFERKCSFIVDDEDFGAAWTHVPVGTFFPAVSLGTGSSGRVRIRFLRVCEDDLFPTLM